MSLDDPRGQTPSPAGDFEVLDADTVCQQCGAVNPEGTLLCKVCGNNLREQREQRIAHGSQPVEPTISRKHIFTGILSGLGVALVLLTVIFLPNIETVLVNAQTTDAQDVTDPWTGARAALYDELLKELDDAPSTRRDLQNALDNPVLQDPYNGRYALILPRNLDNRRFLGEANLSRRGNRVYFVARIYGYPYAVRGFGELEGEEGRQRLVVQRDDAGVRTDSGDIMGVGFAVQRPGGGHTCDYALIDESDSVKRFFAFRIR